MRTPASQIEIGEESAVRYTFVAPVRIADRLAVHWGFVGEELVALPSETGEESVAYRRSAVLRKMVGEELAARQQAVEEELAVFRWLVEGELVVPGRIEA